MAKTNSWIGSPVERREDLRFTTGRGQYVDDLTRPGLIHAVILRSSYAHGKIVKLAVGAAAAMPDVVGIVTAAEIGAVPKIPLRMEPLPELARFSQPVIAVNKVRYVGEPLAVVLADDPYAAEDAAELVDIDIEEAPALLDARAAAQPGAPHLFEAGNVAADFTLGYGDVEGSLSGSPASPGAPRLWATAPTG